MSGNASLEMMALLVEIERSKKKEYADSQSHANS
jgi:hypothetical protein